MSEASPRTEKLLNDVAGLLRTREIVHRVTGEKFNIFRVLNIESREFFICKVLMELLSPSGSHCQGSLFLKPFVKNVLGLNIPDAELERARVSREYKTSQGRRIDIVIETANHFVAIEVKVRAGDLPGQCSDYYEAAKQRCDDENNAKIVYLTPDGRKPSPESSCGKEICVSFRKDIHEWLSSCLSFKEIEHAVPVREIMRQFLMTAESFTGCAKESNMEVKELILRSPENLRAAFELQSGLVYEAVEDLRKRFLEAVNEKLKSQGITHGTFHDDRNYAVQYEYDMPGVAVCLGSGEIDTWVSYVTGAGGGKTGLDEFVGKLEESRGKNFKSGSYDGNFLYWEYCCVDGKGSPNFWGTNPNDATFGLCDPETFDSFVKVCARKIKEFLEFPPE